MAFSDPHKNIQQFGIPEGASVADFGCGSGFYSIAAAQKVGSEGRVYAIDIQRDLLTRVVEEAAAEEIENLEVLWGDAEQPHGTGLSDGVVDRVIISNLLFQVEDIGAVCKEAYRVLKPGGRVLVIEWSDSFGGLGPAPEHVVSEQSVRDALESAGFTITSDIEAGGHHYGVVAQKAKK